MAVFDIDMYDKRVFTGTGPRTFVLERRGESLALKMGDEFYLRPATSKKGTWRVVMSPDSTTKVFSITDAEASRLRMNSMGEGDDH